MRAGVLTVLVFGVLASLSTAGTAIQTDWSGGQGVPGPVIEFGSDFHLESGIDWWQSPGLLSLMEEIVEYPVTSSFDGAHSVHVRDIDGDGDPDIIGAAYEDDEFAWWENSDGSGLDWTKHLISGGHEWAYSVYGDDIDGDGDFDVAGAAYEENTVIWWDNADGSGVVWIPHPIRSGFMGACAVHSEDIDGDGDTDVLAAARTDDEITWFENLNGTGDNWHVFPISTNFNGARSVYTEDIDGDGDPDVLGAAVISDDITWWENSDTTPGHNWVEHHIDQNFSGACAVYADDIDGDGDMDVVGAGVHADEIRWWENLDGSGGAWATHNVAVNYQGAHSAMTDDLDGDGDADIIGTAENDHEVTWWENTDGTGLNWAEHTIDGFFEGAEWACTADFNSDGHQDVTAAAETADAISWWSLTTGNGYLESSILDTEESPRWDYLEWNSSSPSGTALYVQVRASDDHTAMGAWSDSLSEPVLLTGILDDGDRYIQYRVLLQSTVPDETPQFYNITITWDPMGTGGSPGPVATYLMPFTPNPVNGIPVIEFSLMERMVASFRVCDITGRSVAVVGEHLLEQGYHQIQLDRLPPGIYFCRMDAGDFSETRRFVVVD